MGDRSGKRTIRMGADGLPLDDVSHYPASGDVLQGFDDVVQDLYKFKVPVLLDLKDPHAHLMVILLDGTGNDADQDPLHKSNVAKFDESVKELKRAGYRIDSVYIAGPGTQTNRAENLSDNIIGHTSEARAEELYRRVVERAQPIFQADPDAKLSFLVEGFSRGGSEAPLLTQMLDEHGIPDTARAGWFTDELGNKVRTFPHFHQPPGVGPIAIFTYDPVPTGALQMVDRRLPGSVVAGVQLNSSDVRGTFRVDMQIPNGFSEDGRFYSSPFLKVAHSDIAGTYLRNATGAHAFNIATDFHNALLSEPLFLRQHVTDDPRMNVVHRSVEGEMVYRFLPQVDRSLPEGQISTLAPDYWRVARLGEVVSIPVQAPAPMDERFRLLVQSARLVAPSPLAPEPAVPAGEAMLECVMRDKNTTLMSYETPILERPGVRVAAALGAVGVVAGVADAVHTGHRIDTLLAQDNLLSAKHELRNYAVNNANAWVAAYTVGKLGAELGGQRGVYGATAGGVAGGIFGYVLSDKAMEGLDGREIANQTDALGRQWTFNRREWVRPIEADLSSDGVDRPRQQSFSADFDTRRELDYRATNTSIDIALGRLGPPRNPYSLEPALGDRGSLESTHWTRNPENGAWSRQIKTGVSGANDRGEFREEIASPMRAAQLDKQASEVIQANIAHGPAAIAARYDVSYHLNGWDTISGIEKSSAAAGALRPDSLQASNGRQYQLSVDGVWRHHDDIATGNIAAELSATRAALQPQLEQHSRTMTALPVWQRPTQEQQDLASLATSYASYNLDPNPESLAAIQLAVNTTRARFGIDESTTSLTLDPDAQGARDINSPIAHLHTDSRGVVRVAAITTTDDIQRAREEVRNQPLTPIARMPGAPPGGDTSSSDTSSGPQRVIDIQAQTQAIAAAAERQATKQQRQLQDRQAAQVRQFDWQAQLMREDQAHAAQAVQAHDALDRQSQEVQQREQEERHVQESQRREANEERRTVMETQRTQDVDSREAEARQTQEVQHRESEERRGRDAQEQRTKEVQPLAAEMQPPHETQHRETEDRRSRDTQEQLARDDRPFTVETQRLQEAAHEAQERHARSAQETHAHPSLDGSSQETLQRTAEDHTVHRDERARTSSERPDTHTRQHEEPSRGVGAEAAQAASSLATAAPVAHARSIAHEPLAHHDHTSSELSDGHRVPMSTRSIEEQEAHRPSHALKSPGHQDQKIQPSSIQEQGNRNEPGERISFDAGQMALQAHWELARQQQERQEREARQRDAEDRRDRDIREREDQERFATENERREQGIEARDPHAREQQQTLPQDPLALADAEIRQDDIRIRRQERLRDREYPSPQRDIVQADVLASIEQRGEQDDPQYPKRKNITGDRDVDDLLHAIDTKNDFAIEEALRRIGNSPYTQALLKQGHELLEAQALQDAQATLAANQALGLDTAPAEVQTSRGPVKVMSLPEFASGPTMPGGPPSGGDGGGGGGGAGGGGGGGG